MESDVSGSIKSVLSQLYIAGDILWWSRLQAGRIQKGNHWIWLCEDGTWDFACMFTNRSKGLSFMFIESKREDKPAKLRESQERFYERYSNKHKDIHFVVAKDGNSLKRHILSLCHDRLGDIRYGL